MKRLSMFFTLLFAGATFGVANAQTDSNDHRLVSLWASYDKALQADKPREQQAVLLEIKARASREKLLWDWYDASVQYVKAVSMRDWKQRERLRAELEDEIRQAHPSVRIFHSPQAADSLLSGPWAAELKSSRNDAFYKRDRALSGLPFGKILPSLLENDWQWALWTRAMRQRGEGFESLAEIYPEGSVERSLVDFAALSSSKQTRPQALRDFARRHENRAAALLALGELLELRRDSLARLESPASEKAYLELREDCRSFNRMCGGYSGLEGRIAAVCKQGKAILEQLEAPSLDVEVVDGEAVLSLRNLDGARLKVYDGQRLIFKRELKNDRCSFYVPDTLRCRLETPCDGEYRLLVGGGDIEREVRYVRESLSISLRRDAKGTAVFVADYRSGEPIDNCSITLYKDGDSSEGRCGPLDCREGFAYLDAGFASKLEALGYRSGIQASCEAADGTLRLSGILEAGYKSLRRTMPVAYALMDRAVLLTDAGYFTPGQSCRFKAVLLRGQQELQLREGVKVEVSLMDPQGKTLAVRELTSSELGSVHGEFPLGKDLRSGIYRVQLKEGGKVLSDKPIRLERAELPAFTLEWDRDDELHLKGERICLGGRLTDYAGHPMQPQKAVVSINAGSGPVQESEVHTAADGSFRICFKASDRNYDYYDIKFSVTDKAGRSREFSKFCRSTGRISFSVGLENAAPASALTVEDASARLRFTRDRRISIDYCLLLDGREVLKGRLGDEELLELPLQAEGRYRLKAVGSIEGQSEYKTEESLEFIHLTDNSNTLSFDCPSFFKKSSSDERAILAGTTLGRARIVAELFNDRAELIESQLVSIEGRKGEEGSLGKIAFKSDTQGRCYARLLFFRDGKDYSYSCIFDARETKNPPLKLEFTRFEDRTRPSTRYSFQLRTQPGAECAASIFDIASENFMDNRWHRIESRQAGMLLVSFRELCGRNDSDYLLFARPVYSSSLSMKSAAVNLADDFVESEALDEQAAEQAPDEKLRSDLSPVLFWAPELKADKDGLVELSFKTSDRLSRFAVQVFAHDRKFSNNSLRQLMTVSLPVKLDINRTGTLFEGDSICIPVSVSSLLESKQSGVLEISFLRRDGSGKVLDCSRFNITVEPSEVISRSAGLLVPEGLSRLGILARFIPDGAEEAADALLVELDVKPAVQTIVEAHSALVADKADEPSVEALLRSRFGRDGELARKQTIDIAGMVRQALGERKEQVGRDLVSLVDALYADILSSCELGAPADSIRRREYLDGILQCRCSDGGFGWRAGMRSSPVLTAVLLEKAAGMGEDCPPLLSGCIEDAVRFIDSSMLEPAKPLCGLDLGQYLHTRSLYPHFTWDASGLDARGRRELRKAIRTCLLGSDGAPARGQILAKARVACTLENLLAGEDGKRLASAWGLGGSRMSKTLQGCIESLAQYSVEHPGGGLYYPNAVLPYRGLLENELYAHTLLCRIMDRHSRGEIAEGLRLWMMIQKESQQWGSDPAFIDAAAQVLRGSEKTLGTKLMVLSLERSLPLDKVLPASNGVGLEVSYSLVQTVDGKRVEKPLKEGDALKIGDRILARYALRSDENRSFVKLTVPRCAAFNPVSQISGVVRSGAYRDLREDRTEYWFDLLPEEDSQLFEEFFVTNEGRFQGAAAVLESSYAPHYRANTGAFLFGSL